MSSSGKSESTPARLPYGSVKARIDCQCKSIAFKCNSSLKPLATLTELFVTEKLEKAFSKKYGVIKSIEPHCTGLKKFTKIGKSLAQMIIVRFESRDESRNAWASPKGIFNTKNHENYSFPLKTSFNHEIGCIHHPKYRKDGSNSEEVFDVSLEIQPSNVVVPGIESESIHTLSNMSERRLAFKVFCVEGEHNGVYPREGVLKAGERTELAVLLVKAANANEKLTIEYAEIDNEEDDLNELMASSSDDSYTPEKEQRKKQKVVKRKRLLATKEKKPKSLKKVKKIEFETKAEKPKKERQRTVTSPHAVIIHSADCNTEDAITQGLGTSHQNDPSLYTGRVRITKDSDKKYTLEERKRHSQAISVKNRRKRGKVKDEKNAERMRNSRQRRHEASMTPLDDGFLFEVPVILPSNFLGLMNNECAFCGALHFAGHAICCLNGKVFVPPLAKLSEPLQSLFHGPRGRNYGKTNKFLKEVIKYNANFSFASTQYIRNPVAKFGVQAVRARGAVHHYPSAALPHENREPVFGNVYVFQGSDAVDIRMNSPFSANFDRELIEKIQEMLVVHNPLADMYYSMGKQIARIKETGGKVEHLRLKIVEPSKVDRQALQAHEGVYAKPIVYKDYVALFYTSSVEQEVNLPGLIVYPKHGFGISRPIFPWSDLINPLCYPLLFPNGERGWAQKKLLYCNERMTATERLQQYASMHPTEAELWDTPFHQSSTSRTQLVAQDPRIDHPEINSDEDENLNEDVYNAQLNQIEEDESVNEDQEIVFEERGGVMYPIRVRQLTRRTTQPHDDLADDSGNEGDEHEEYEEVVHEEATISTPLQPHDENVDEANPHEIVHRKYVSFREWILYQMQLRKHFKNRYAASGKLGQLFLIDSCTRLFKSRADFIQKHHSEFMTSTRKKFLDAYQRRIAGSGRRIGCITSIPSSVPGSPRYLQQKYEDVVALANEYGPPDLFITFTANVNWPEIQENIPHGSTWADYPFLVNEVFWKKFEEFKIVVLGKPVELRSSTRRPGLFGPVRWWSFSVEFQQRGPPHVHLIVSLVNHVRTAADVDKICQATIPHLPCSTDSDYDEKVRLRNLVCDLMIHRPCENDPEAYCQKDKEEHWKTCKKHFPKEFSNETHFGDLTYPELIRPNDGEFTYNRLTNGKRVKATNRHVVPYNTQLITMFESHINVEVISALRSVKYIFKYEFKGYDRCLVETITSNSNQVSAGNMTIDGHIMYPKNLKLTKETVQQRNLESRERLRQHNVNLVDENGCDVLVYDETHFVEDLRSLTSCEAAWEFASLLRTDCSHVVVTVFVHQPREEPIHYDLNTEEDMFERLEGNEVPSRLKAWFKLNADQDATAQGLFYHQLPQYYRYVKDHWVKRKITLQNLIGRTKAVHPKNIELYAIRLLSSNRTNITSFKALRTVNGEVFPTFVAAAKEMNLMNDHREWDFALKEASRDKMPIHLRRLFASILLFCAPLNPFELWEHYKEEFYENRSDWTVEKREAHALFHIQSILKYHGSSLKKQNLPEIQSSALPPRIQLCSDDGYTTIGPSSAENIARKMYQNMNVEQKIAHDTIVASINSNERKSFFLNASGGCGKTYMFNALCHELSVHNKVLCVAHTGIAAILLPRGRTAHRAFHIPLTTESDMHCKINLEDDLAAELSGVNVVLWDEATMTDRRILEAVNKIMCALHPEDASSLFGGVPFIFGGDWKQTLPILKDVRGAGILGYTILRSDLWKNIKLLNLTQNVRALNDPQYAKYLLDVGCGNNKDCSLPEDAQKIDLPTEVLVQSEKEIIDAIFGHGQILNPTSNAAILTVDNATSIALNDKILDLLPGEKIEYKSIDSYDENSGFSILDSEVYNQLTPKGMPPHKLKLKVAAIVMLLRNINVELSLCNGTRLKILKLGQRVLTCEPVMKSANSPEIVYIPRMLLSTSVKATSRDLAFHRFQFPIRLAYAMTVHKSQGQTLSKMSKHRGKFSPTSEDGGSPSKKLETEDIAKMADKKLSLLSQEQQPVCEQPSLSVFDISVADPLANSGYFIILRKEFALANPTKATSVNVLRLLMRDKEDKNAEFVAFDEKANEIHEGFEIGQVVFVSGFRWREIQYADEANKFFGFLMEKQGILNQQSEIHLDQNLSETFGTTWKVNLKQLFGYLDILKYPMSFVAVFKSTTPIKEYDNDRGAGAYKIYTFEGIGKLPIEMVFFNEAATFDYELITNKAYTIYGASLNKKKVNNENKMNLVGNIETVIELCDIAVDELEEEEKGQRISLDMVTKDKIGKFVVCGVVHSDISKTDEVYTFDIIDGSFRAKHFLAIQIECNEFVEFPKETMLECAGHFIKKGAHLHMQCQKTAIRLLKTVTTEERKKMFNGLKKPFHYI